MQYFLKKVTTLSVFLLVVFLVAFSGVGHADAATCSATVSGNWNTGSNWSGCSGAGGIPGANDNITINAGVTITMNANSASLGTITVNGTLNTSDGTSRSLSGTTLAIGSTGTLTANASTITLSGTTGTPLSLTSGGTFNAGTSTITLTGNNAAGNTTVSKDFSYYNLNINNSAETFVLNGTTTINAAGTLTITNGTLDTTASNYTLNAGKISLATSASTCVLTANASTINLTATSGALFSRSANAVFNAGTSTVVLTGNGDATFNSGTATTFYNVTSSGTGTKTLGLALTLSAAGTLSVTNGTFSTGASNLALSVGHIDVQAGGTLTLNTSTMTLTTTDGDPVLSTAGTFSNTAFTVTYTGINASGDTIIGSGIPYYNLTLNGSGEVYVLEGPTTVSAAGTLTVSTGTLNTTTSNYALSAGKISTANTSVAILTFNGSTVSVTATSGTAFSKGSGSVFNAGTSTVDFTGNGDITLTGAATVSFYNMKISGTGTKSMAIATTVTNVLTITAGTLTTTASNFAPTIGNLDLQSGGTFTLNAATLTFTGTDGDPVDTITGTLNTGTSTITYNGNNGSGNTIISKDISYYNLTLNNSAETYELEGATTVSTAGTLTITAGTLTTTASNYTLSVGKIITTNAAAAILTLNSSTVNLTATSGTLFNRGSSSIFNAGTSTVVVAGDGDETILTNPTTFYNLTIASTGTKSLGQTLTVSNVLSITNGTLTTVTNIAVTAGTLSIGASGTFSANSSVITLNGTTGTPFQNAGTFNAGTSTVTYTGNNTGGNTTIDMHATYYNLTLNNSAETFVVEGNTTIDPAATLTISNGTLDTTASNYSISAGKINVANVSTAILTLNASTLTLTATSGTLFTRVGASVLNMGTSTVVLVGNGDAIVNSGIVPFYNLTSSGTGTKTIATNLSVTNNLVITNGTFSTNPGTALPVGTIDVQSGGTLSLFASGVTISGTNGNPFSAAGTVNVGTSTITYTGNNPSGNTIIHSGITYYNLTLNNSAETYVLEGATTVDTAGTLTITNGTLDTTSNNYPLTFGKLAIASASTAIFNMNDSLIVATSTGTAISKGTLGVMNPGTSEVQLAGAGNTNLNGTFYDLVIAGSGTKNTGASGATVNHDLTIASGIWNGTTSTITGSGTNTIHVQSGGILQIGASSFGAVIVSFETRDMQDGSTVQYLGAVQTIDNTITYSNLTLMNSGTKSLGGATTVSGTLTINTSATLTTTSSNHALSVKSIDIQSTGTLVGNASTITVSTNWTNAGTFTPGTSTVVFNTGTSSLITGATTFYNLTIAHTGAKEVLFSTAGNPIYAVTNTFTVNGAASAYVKLYSDVSGTQWYFNPTGTASVNYADVRDGACASGATNVYMTNSISSGNNDACWSFASTRFVITDPTDTVVGTPVIITIRALRADNTVDTHYQNDVTLSLSGSASGAGLVNIVNGVGTATISDVLAETVTLSLVDSQATGLDVSSTQDLVFTPGPLATILITDPGDVLAKNRVGYTITRKDSYGNMATGSSDTVYLFSTSTSSTSAFYNDAEEGSRITSITLPEGEASASFWYYDEEPGTYTISVSDNGSSPDGVTGVVDGADTLTVIPVAVRFVILPVVDATVDSPTKVTIQAQNPDDTVDTRYQHDVTLEVTGTASGGGIVNIVNGIGTAAVSDSVMETITLSLVDSESTGLDVSSTQDVVFAGGATSQFVLSDPESISAGSRAEYLVTRKDQYGNNTTTGTTTAYLYSTSMEEHSRFYDQSNDGAIIASVVFLEGESTKSFWYYDEEPGTYSITASDNYSSPDGNVGINDAVDIIAVSPGAVAQFSLSDPGDMTAGTRLGYTVTRQDAFGNPVSSGETFVYLFSRAENGTSSFWDAALDGSSETSLLIPDGQTSSDFWYSQETPGLYTITASDNASGPDEGTGIVDGTDLVTVGEAPIVATRLVVLDPGDGSVDAPIAVTIQAQDVRGNLDTTYEGSVQVNLSGSAVGGGVVTIINGVGTLSISDAAAESVVISLADTLDTGLDVSSTVNVLFSTGTVSQFALTDPGDMAAGTRIGYTVTRKDQFGNLVSHGTTTVYLYGLDSSDEPALMKTPPRRFYDSADGGSVISFVNITEGNSEAEFWYYDEEAGVASVVVSDNTENPDGEEGIADVSDTVSVSSGLVSRFLVSDPGDMYINTRIGYTVSREDSFGNPVTVGMTIVHLYTTATDPSSGFYDAVSGGSKISSISINDGESTGAFWYYGANAGTWTITVSDSSSGPNGSEGVSDDADAVIVSTIPIVATKLVILEPEDQMVNTPTNVTVQAQDDEGNVDTTYNGTVRLITSGSTTGGGIIHIVSGVGSLEIVDAKAETVMLSLATPDPSGLSFGSTSSVTFSSLPPVYTGAAPSEIRVVEVGRVAFSGVAYPGAHLVIKAISDTEEILKESTVSSHDGKFDVAFKGLSSGARAFALLVEDKEGRLAQSFVYNLNLVNSNSVLDIDDIIVSPTIDFPRPTVTKGDVLSIVGYAAPRSKVALEIDEAVVATNIDVASDGSYKYLYSTAPLDYGSHSVKVITDYLGSKSSSSPQKVFFTTNLSVPKTDLNNSGKIDLGDWSIFLSRWRSKDAAVRMLDDLSGDGKVDVSDFSIFTRVLNQ